MKLKVKKLNSLAIIPKKAHENDAAFDLFTNHTGMIPKGGIGFRIHTGIAVEIPKGWYMQISLRSGKAANTGLRLSNGVGVIDSGYTGEIIILVDNVGWKTEEWYGGERIAQAVLLPVPDVELEETKELAKTERGDGKFGSTGL